MPKNKSIIPSTCMISTPVQDERERKREREGGDRGRERERLTILPLQEFSLQQLVSD